MQKKVFSGQLFLKKKTGRWLKNFFFLPKIGSDLLTFGMFLQNKFWKLSVHMWRHVIGYFSKNPKRLKISKSGNERFLRSSDNFELTESEINHFRVFIRHVSVTFGQFSEIRFSPKMSEGFYHQNRPRRLTFQKWNSPLFAKGHSTENKQVPKRTKVGG